MECGWTIYSNDVCRMMTSLSVTKYPPVSSSRAEAAINVKMLQFACIGTFRRYHIHLEGMLPKKNTLQRNCVLLVHSYMKHWCRRVKLCLKREIWPLHLDMLPCNQKLVHVFLILFCGGNLLLPLCLMVLSTCGIPPLNTIKNFLLWVHIILLDPLVVLVTYWAVWFSGHLHHMSFLALDMAYAVAFLVFYEQICASIILHIYGNWCVCIPFV